MRRFRPSFSLTKRIEDRHPTLFRLYRLVLSEWERLQITALASQVAFSAVFAIPSLVFLVMSLAAIVNASTGIPVADWLREQIERQAPDQLRDLLIFIVDEAIARSGAGLGSIGAVIAAGTALYSASGVVNALVNASSRAFGIPNRRNYLVKRAVAALLTIVLAALVILAGVVFIGSQSVVRWLSDLLGGGGTMTALLSLLRWPAIVVSFTLALVVLYAFGLSDRPPLRWTVPGAFLASIAWLAVLWAYRNVLGVIDPGSPYGATGSVLVLLSFLYTTGIVFVLGAALNGILVRWRLGDTLSRSRQGTTPST